MRMENKIILAPSAQHPCAHAIVLGFAREGANCVLVDEDASQAEQLAAQVRSLGRRALPPQFDVTKKSQVEEIVKRAVTEFGRIDVCSTVRGSRMKAIS
jgi:NAD(P)-dependent dehydrogenase (short-subunit alcohol dehydrogenase family)